MKNLYKSLIICTIIALVAASTTPVFAGNRDRSGQAGASHLLIDPWARTSGLAGAGVAEVRGLESVFTNVAGLTSIRNMELSFNRTQYLVGSQANIALNSFGIAKKLGKNKDFGVLAVSFFSQSFGDVMITTNDQPEGGLGYFSPTLTYIGLHYAKSFNNFIKGGVSIKIINERISDSRATGFAIDAGVQYVTGKFENFKIGVTLKNIGLPMSYKGDGLSVRGTITNQQYEQTLEMRSAEFEMPSLLSIGVSYDLLFFGAEYAGMSRDELSGEGLTRDDAEHRITFAGAFTANSYTRDVFSLGLEYGFRNIFMVRAGYALENISKGAQSDINETAAILFNSETFFAGPSVGASVVIPLTAERKKHTIGPRIYLDYGYRFTNKWRGNHYMGVKVTL
jgi:hypothetical protein